MIDFAGNERFTIRRRLGAGAFGVVYEAHDRERDAAVALKTLQHVDATAIYRFKQEFRSLSHVVHPNLVTLHELVASGDRLFFTMDLVQGVDFFAWVRPPREIAFDATVERSIDASSSVEGARPPRPLPTLDGLDVARLRAAMRQLAEGVNALHAAGKMHRDLKPSNVMVTPEGRVVLLDFGLVADVRPGRLRDSLAQRIVGTPWYMAPEQGRGVESTAACDWYAVGVMLYEALTGVLPFDGVMADVLVAKITRDAVPAATLLPGVPEDLSQLASALLSRRPEERPDGATVSRRLGLAPPDVRGSMAPPSLRPGQVLIGRRAQLDALDRAFGGRSDRDGARVVQVHGRSGMGKSTLVRAFLDGVAHVPDAVVLEGRVYERESVPFKALDSLIDALARHLRELDEDDRAAALLPRDIATLARVFPVLRRVDAVENAPRPEHDVTDPHELRGRAAVALRELLDALSAKGPLVLAIDDVQWGDVDSAALLLELVRSPDAPPLMLLLAHREEDSGSSALLRAIRDGLRAEDVVDVAVDALLPEDARELALRALGRRDPEAVALADSIALESRGSPFFVDELVRSAQAGETVARAPGDGGAVRLDRVLLARMERLEPDARRLLEAVALIGRPVAQSVVFDAAALGPHGATALAMLRAQHFVRTQPASAGQGTHDEVECYHDRVRETAAAHVAAESLRAMHARIAASLERLDDADPEELSVHLAGAGDAARAAQFAIVAAGRADAALAFDRAAGLYRAALESLGSAHDPAHRRALIAAEARALANAGRNVDAARLFREAADGADPDDALELHRHAAEHFLVSGELEAGLDALTTVQQRFGVALSASPAVSTARLLWYRARLRLRGLSYRARAESVIPRATLSRTDTFRSVARGLAMVDSLRAAEFQTRNLLLSLDAGEPHRIARALAVEAGFVSTGGGRASKRVARLVEASRSLAVQIDDPQALALATMASGVAEYFAGRFASALPWLDQAESIFRDRCAGVAWELSNTQLYVLWSLYYLGHFAELSERVPDMIRRAVARGDRYTATTACTGLTNVVWLVDDDAPGALRVIDEAMAPWASLGFHVQHYFALHARVDAMLYAGDAAAALSLLDASRTAISRSLLLQVQFIQLEFHGLVARACLAVASSQTVRGPLLARVDRAARSLARARLPWSDTLASLARAGACRLRGDDAGALALYEGAAFGANGAGMAMFAAAARRRAGELTPGDEGLRRVAEADAWMTAQRVKRPARIVAMLAPGDPIAAALPG